ncbi:MAG: hypothetical protein M0C28_41625 [Candidatus Moduliflexus flocculans]|nr:hypothetical protein [Candidatus Moduliflexus flocculans]
MHLVPGRARAGERASPLQALRRRSRSTSSASRRLTRRRRRPRSSCAYGTSSRVCLGAMRAAPRQGHQGRALPARSRSGRSRRGASPSSPADGQALPGRRDEHGPDGRGRAARGRTARPRSTSTAGCGGIIPTEEEVLAEVRRSCLR